MLKKGIYEKIIDSETKADMDVAKSEDLFCQTEEMDDAESPKILADYLAGVIRKKLEDVEKLNDRVKLVNNIFASCGIEGIEIVDDEKLLMEVMTHQRHFLQEKSHSTTIRPLGGFRVSNLFTGGTSVLSIGEEIRREIATADRISFIVSFLKLSGVRIMIDDLRRFCEQEGKSLRLITTTYCGITEAKALQQLSELPNTKIRISYNTKVERLHAKAYIFERNSGMNTAYIGSSNLSKSAQTDGLEWNVRVTSEENPHIIKTALATFDMYWNSPNFEDFSVGGIDKFNKELKQEDGGDGQVFLPHFSLQPFQKQILDKLRVEREELDNNRNLVVAATGTGKTVMSAFDYLSFYSNRGAENKRLLYIAHREEILLQSLNTYRSVLRNPNFGALWVGNYNPQDETEYEYLFLSVSMFNNRFDEVFSKLDADYYAYIVVDEAHHSQANSYRKLFSHFSPRILLGLTATPERMDGKDLRPDFGGHISAEMRLPNALQAGLLTPFQYLCVTDNTDLSDDTLWNGRYIAEGLANRLCREERAMHIMTALDKYLPDINGCRALCFCVNKRHAEFMAEQFKNNGLKAESLTSDTDDAHRKQYANSLRDGSLNYLCVVDVFNEGVDLPEVDTVLFLRPTESLTVFLQQLGRGLRLYPGKTELTVLDFIAQVNKKYDYASKFRSLSLRPDKNVAKQVENGFTFLPSGCNIVMEKVARQYVLDNIRGAIFNMNRIVRDLQSYDITPTIEQFLESNGQDIRILYRNDNCWSSLKRAANKINYDDDDITDRLESNIKNLIHHNTASFLHFVRDFVNGSKDYRKEEYVKFSTMLYYNLFAERIDNTNFNDIYEALDTIHKERYSCFKEEISQVVNYLIEHLNIQTEPLGNEVLPGVELYGCYTREEIFTLTGRQTPTRRMQGVATGVFNLQEPVATLLFVTLNKSDKDFSPSTQYDDYVIDEMHFHWQSQNKDSHSNKGGQKYTMQSKKKNKIILFVREEKKDVLGTAPFHCFGLVNYVESWGDRPMNVKWRMVKPIMPQYLKVV